MRQQKLCEMFGFDAQCAIKDLHPPFSFADVSKTRNGPKFIRRGSSLLQTRICNRDRCTHRLSFLSLPTPVRHQIYLEAGLIHDKNIYLHKVPEDQNDYENDYQTTLSLLLTCHAIHQEVFAILYSTNRFYVNFRLSKSLAPIRYLIPKALALITHLVISMNQTSCDVTGCCGQSGRQCNGRICWGGKRHPEPFRLPCAQKALTEWNITAKYLSTYITPSRLALVFICDVRDLETAQLAVEPFFSMSKLASCQIRLAWDTTFKFLAEKAAATATGQASQRRLPFHFLKLHTELRLAILRLTDLVTPHCEVEVDTNGRYRARNAPPDPWQDHPRYIHAAQFLYCSQEENNCLCRLYHSAVSECRCWSPPTSLFLVCKSMREIATETFFSRNRFVVMPLGWRDQTPPPPLLLDQFPASIFFQRAQRQNTLRFLRRIDLPLPAYRTGYQQPTESAFSDWQKTVENICRKENRCSGISITIFVGYAGVLRQMPIGPENHYHGFCEPLASLKLRKFYVHTVQHFPWHANGHYYTVFNTPAQAKHASLLMEKDLEKLVMGKEYSSDHTELMASGFFELECFSLAAIEDFTRSFR